MKATIRSSSNLSALLINIYVSGGRHAYMWAVCRQPARLFSLAGVAVHVPRPEECSHVPSAIPVCLDIPSHVLMRGRLPERTVSRKPTHSLCRSWYVDVCCLVLKRRSEQTIRRQNIGSDPALTMTYFIDFIKNFFQMFHNSCEVCHMNCKNPHEGILD